MLTIFAAFSTVLITISLAILVKYFTRDRFTDGIPEPPAVPFFRHMFYFWNKDERLAGEKLWEMRKGCDVFRVDYLGSDPSLFVRGLKCIEKVIRSPSIYGRSSIVSQIVPAFSGSVIDVEGDVHKEQKAFLAKAFSHDHMRSYIPIFHKWTDLTCKELAKQCDDSGLGKSIKILDYFSDASFSIFQEAGIGITADTDTARHISSKVKKLFGSSLSFGSQMALYWLQPILSRIPFGPIQHYQKIIGMYFDILQQALLDKKKRLESGKKNTANILSMLLEHRWKEGSSLTDQMLTGNILLLTFAGYETTARALSWCVYNLAQYPHIQEKARKELREIAKSAAQLTYEDTNKLRYLTNVIKETLRFSTVVPHMSRKVKEDTILGKHNLKKGQQMFIHTHCIHRDEDIFPEADCFDPDRFENMPPEQSSMFIPFGCAPYTCLGKRFAMVKMLIILAHILQNFQINVDPDYKGFVTYNKMVRVDTPPLQVCLKKISNTER